MEDSAFSLFGLVIFVPAEVKQIALAALFGLLVGVERAWRNKVASLRTFSMISAGSCIFSIMSVSVVGATTAEYDVSRIAAQIVSGVGFLGGGVIFKTSDRIEGITTAAMIWLTAALGMACGFNQIRVAIWSFFVFYFLNIFSIILHRLIDEVQERAQLRSKIAAADRDVP